MHGWYCVTSSIRCAKGSDLLFCITYDSIDASRCGPDTVLTAAEEKMLVEYAIHMEEIGYGRTRDQLCNTMKKILADLTPSRTTYLEKSGGLSLRNVIQ